MNKMTEKERKAYEQELEDCLQNKSIDMILCDLPI